MIRNCKADATAIKTLDSRERGVAQEGSRRARGKKQEEGFQRAVEQGQVQGHEEAGGCHWGSTYRYFHPKGMGRLEQVSSLTGSL